MNKINITDPIFRGSAEIKQSLVDQMNKSPTLISWVIQYNAAVVSGTHQPMIDGEGRYLRPGEQGNSPSGVPLPGAIRVRFNNLKLRSSKGSGLSLSYFITYRVRQ